MRKIHKITNIAFIFTLISVLVCPDCSPHNLRPLSGFDSSEKNQATNRFLEAASKFQSKFISLLLNGVSLVKPYALIKYLPREEVIHNVPIHTALHHKELCDWVEGNKNIPERPNLLILDSHIDNYGSSMYDSPWVTGMERQNGEWLKTKRDLFGKVYLYYSPLSIKGGELMSTDGDVMSLGLNLKENLFKGEAYEEYIRQLKKQYAKSGIVIITEPEECAQIEGPTLISCEMDFFECEAVGGRWSLEKRYARKILDLLCDSLKSSKIEIVGVDFTLAGEPFLPLKKAFSWYRLARKKFLDKGPFKVDTEERADNVSTQKQSLENIEFLARKLPKERLPDFILSDGETEILLSTDLDSNELFRIYIKEDNKWNKIQPLVQDTLGIDANIEIDITIIEGLHCVVLDVVDLGKVPPKGVAKLIFHWLSYLAKAKDSRLKVHLTQNPRGISLLSQVTDFAFNVDFLYDKEFLVGRPGTPISIAYKEGRHSELGLIDSIPDEYVVNVEGDYETWVPRHKDHHPQAFEGWVIDRRMEENRKKWYSLEDSPITLKKNGIITDNDGEVIGQILAFPKPVSATGNPMPDKGGFISVTMPDKELTDRIKEQQDLHKSL